MVVFARLIELVGAAWIGSGLLFGLVFVFVGVQRIDPMAAGASLGFRLLILPGTVIFWPLLAARWALGASHPPLEVNAHRRDAARRGLCPDQRGAS